jgi:hypothetical protein
MFYATQLKSVTSNGAVDVQGRSLTFIGYLQVKAGDTVYTDGKVVFGNAPPKGAPAIFDEPSGVPVLGDNYFLGEQDEQDDELRGYFTKSGKYKSYQIAGDDWIVNDRKIFKHDEGDNIIDAEIADDEDDTEEGIYTVEKNIYFPNPYVNDYDYHQGFYKNEPSDSIYGALSLIRIAVCCEGDYPYSDRSTFYNHPVVGFQQRDYLYAEYYGLGDYLHAPFYYNTGTSVNSSYQNGYYSAFENESTGSGIRMRLCNFLLRGQNLDYKNFDGKISKQCELIIRRDDKVFQRVTIADLLKTFEDVAKAEVDLFPARESVKHLKSRAVVRNFKVKPNADWVLLLEAEIWASNTFYNNTEEPVSHNPLILDTNPFHISSTVSHNHLMIIFKSDDSHEEIFKWKMLYPLQLRDSTFGEYYFGEKRETTATVEGAWIVRTMSATAGVVNGQQRYYTEIWRDYDSRREASPLNYDTPTLEVADFNFPVQDDYHATIENVDADITKWKLGGISDADNKQVIGAILPDETDVHKWNISFVQLKGGDCLLGIHKDTDRDIGGALYKIDKDSNVEQVGDGLKNFRLRELKKILLLSRELFCWG